jgi:hypothetical protein
MEFNVKYRLVVSDKKVSPTEILRALSQVVMYKTSKKMVKICWV